MFNNPQIQYLSIFKKFLIPLPPPSPPLILIHRKHSNNDPKILKKLLNPVNPTSSGREEVDVSLMPRPSIENAVMFNGRKFETNTREW